MQIRASHIADYSSDDFMNRRHDGAYTFFALMISIGAIIAAFRDCLNVTGIWILLAAFPLAWYIIWTLEINRKIIPACINKGRYGLYVIVIFLLSMTVPVFGIALEYGIREYFRLGHNISNYFSPWILLDSLSTAALLMTIMFGTAMMDLYLRWRQEMRREKRAGKTLGENIIQFRERIQPDFLLGSIDKLIIACHSSADETFRKLQELSKELRRRLYLDSRTDNDIEDEITDISAVETFISQKRFAAWRIVLLELFIALVSVTAIFNAPDSPDLSLDGLAAFIGMDFIFNVLIFGNIILTRRFIRKGRLVKYLISIGGFILAIGIFVVILQLTTYQPGIYGAQLPVIYPILSTLASLSAIALVLCGVSAFMALQEWLAGRRRIVRLRAETRRLELRILQSQINPHFLFNVLNNVGMLVYESINEAEDMLVALRALLRYLIDVERETTTVAEEVEFINCYLSLEKSRKDPFDYMIEVDENASDLEIPTLLLIPFVENAAKHSTVVNGRRDIFIKISLNQDSFCFSCRNSFVAGKERTTGNVGGLGIQNTLRRLQLIFDQDFSVNRNISDGEYIVEVKWKDGKIVRRRAPEEQFNLS